MTIDLNATLIAYVFLSCFDLVSERERDVVCFVLDLLSSYDILTGELPMTQNVALLAQIYVHELCVMAAYYRQESEGLSWSNQIDPSTLLNAVLLPLIRNLSHDQFQDIVSTADDAEAILSYPLDMLNELVANWKNSKRNRDLATRLNRSTPSLKPKGLSENTPRSECRKEMELLSSSNTQRAKSKTKPRTFRLVLPSLTIRPRIGSFSSSKDQKHEPWGIDPYHVVDEAFEKELQELVEHGPDVDCLCHTGHLCFIHAEGHPCDYESKPKIISRGGIKRRIKSGLKMVMPSR
ncbi:hypothetical protein RSOLAG1IB_03151 [Rhizoctonia solani AG-1 IB]|uniref:Uncharacterized protein n=1 Tax=Thanatephorus cucumeris (strain AG1-IB / isolate 7/3/14) TaxID=1108050 RepID=A0A0B7FSM3_THACB|nr:hypothetical protein RSOLAG1IB_03151 [Rhizoctonia solani AG-1 IB]